MPCPPRDILFEPARPGVSHYVPGSAVYSKMAVAAQRSASVESSVAARQQSSAAQQQNQDSAAVAGGAAAGRLYGGERAEPISPAALCPPSK